MEIQKVTDTAFAKYGKVMSDIPVERILKEMEHTPLPEDVIYVPSVGSVGSTSGCGGSQRKRIWRAADSDWVL